MKRLICQIRGHRWEWDRGCITIHLEVCSRCHTWRWEDAWPGRCRMDDDGECRFGKCPQVRDNEPAKTGRDCPIYTKGSIL